MRRRGRLAKKRVPAELSAPIEEHIDESVNVSILPPVPSEPSQAGPSHSPEPAGVNIPLDPMAQILATAFRQPREPTMSFERARKLRARNYDGIGDPEKAWSWLEGNERVFNVMGCSDEYMVTCDAPKPGGPLTTRQPAEFYVSHVMRPIHVQKWPIGPTHHTHKNVDFIQK